MNKKFLIVGIVSLSMLAACNRLSEEKIEKERSLPSPTAAQTAQIAAQTLPADLSVLSEAGSYMYYTTADGLYRSNLDGSGKTILASGEYLSFIGNTNKWIYFADADKKLYKINENGQSKSLLLDKPVLNVIIANGTVYYIQSKEIYSINADNSIKKIMTIPDDILQQPYAFRTDGVSLYLCTYLELGICYIYKLDLENGRINSQLENVSDNPFTLYKDNVIQVNDTGNKYQIYKQDISTGVKIPILDYTGLLYDMCVYEDWLVYITQPINENKKYVNGFNLNSGKTFRLETQGDSIGQALESQIVLINSDDNSMSRLIIKGDNTYIGAF